MTQIAIERVHDLQPSPPVVRELAKRTDEVRQRAFDLFERRGSELGHQLDDWFAAERDVIDRPSAELRESDSAYELQVTLPGFDANEVRLAATADEVVVHASTQKRASGYDRQVLWTEFGGSDVYRRFVFPLAVKPEAMTAEFDKGLLRVSAPKAKESPKSVPTATDAPTAGLRTIPVAAA